MPTKAIYQRDREYYLASARAYAAAHPKPPRPTLGERVWAKVDKTASCWNWLGTLGAGGRYGSIRAGGRKTRIVHVLTYEWARGLVPEGLELDHLCRNRRCVNPEHLEPVTHRENLRRGSQHQAVLSRGDMCIRGHKGFVAGRVCRTCHREVCRRYRARKRTAA